MKDPLTTLHGFVADWFVFLNGMSTYFQKAKGLSPVNDRGGRKNHWYMTRIYASNSSMFQNDCSVTNFMDVPRHDSAIKLTVSNNLI